jgi:hypothetical protein
MKKTLVMIITTIAIMVAVGIGGVSYYKHLNREAFEKVIADNNAKEAKRKLDAETAKKVAAEKEAEKLAAEKKAWIKKLDRAIVGNGEGYEHSFKRQLIDNPQGFKKHRFGGDLENKVAIRKWAENEVDEIFTASELYNKNTDDQVRVKKANYLAPLLVEDVDGNISIQDYVKDKDGNFPSEPGHPKNVYKVSDGTSESTFIALIDEDGKTYLFVSYLYVYSPMDGVVTNSFVSEI